MIFREKRLGLIYQEAPVDIVTPQKALDGYAIDVMEWKAIQELSPKLDVALTELENLKAQLGREITL